MPSQFQHPHFDAAENINIERKLEFVRSKTYDQPYPELLARQLIPVTHEAPAGAETIKYDIYDKVGLAQRIRSYSDNLPRADVKVREDRVPVHGYGIAYGYSKQELRSSIMSGANLDTKKANAARYGFELRVELIGASGNGEGLVGLLNIPNANVYTVPADGTASSALWTAKTEDLILRDMNGVCNKSASLTNGIETPDTLLMPLDQYNLAATKRVTNTTSTVLEFFLRTSPYIKSVIPWFRCKAAGSGATDRMVAYRRSPEKLNLEIPLEFEQNPPEARGLGVEIACEGRIAGVICPFPMSITYGDGI